MDIAVFPEKVTQVYGQGKVVNQKIYFSID
jgi:hypothetical protein